ncbi:MAG: transglutaminase domain-containing protein, partial [Acetatifactor sp.]|nr:transglutaminase domain-containing protein [Acetatifactor sp.]
MVSLDSEPRESQVRVPTASGTVTYDNDIVSVDASNVGNGYVMIKYTGSVNKIKVQISRGDLTYTYDLNARDAYEVFPLSEGDGTYSVKVFENVSGKQYSQAFSQDVEVSLEDQFEPFLYPNQYVNFTQESDAVQRAAEMAAGAENDLGIVDAVYNYVIDNLTYDTEKAENVQSGYLPDVDQVLAAGKGICFDYAALMVSMLRSQDIPAKLVVGYTGSVYHAWVN